jgi:N-acetyl-anhydromuramyl-L-alanine amidase AmpD
MADGWNEMIELKNIIPCPITNFSAGRPDANHKITHIVVHITGSPESEEGYEASKNEFLKPGNQKSIHYLIKKNGMIMQLVKDSDRAWHAGIRYGDGIIITNQNSVFGKINEKELYDRVNDDWKKWRLGWRRDIDGDNKKDAEYYVVENPTGSNNWNEVYPDKDKPFNYKINMYPNNYSIGIELVGGTFTNADDYKRRSTQIDALIMLLKNLTQKHGVIPDREHIVGHEDVNPIARFHWDPGPGFDWKDVIGRIKPQIIHPLQVDLNNSTPPLWWYHDSESGQGGYYPIGANVCTHSGIHTFTSKIDAVSVRAMAPGYIVACRFLSPALEDEMRKKQVSSFTVEIEGQKKERFYDPSYSSFILLRHDIKLKNGDKEEDGCFYSLYMSIAPIRLQLLKNVPWYQQLVNLIKGADIEIVNYNDLGKLKWIDINKDISPVHSGRDKEHKLNSLSIKKEGDFVLITPKDKPDTVVTFSEPLFSVNGGEIIGYTEKTSYPEDKKNFIHWEILAPAGNDVFKKIAKAYGNESLFASMVENDNYLKTDELEKIFKGESFTNYSGVTLATIDTSFWTSLSVYSRAAIFPSPENYAKCVLYDKMIFNSWLPLYYMKDKSYDLSLKLAELKNYSIISADINLKIKMFTSSETVPIFLKGKKSGTNYEFKYPGDNTGDEYKESVNIKLDDLKNGIKLTIPLLGKELIFTYNDKVISNIELKCDKEKDLFDKESQDNLRNTLLKHKSLWTINSLNKLTDALKENQVIDKGYNFNKDDFKSSAWLDSEKEKSIYQPVFSSKFLSPDIEYHNVHPVTISWLMSFLLDVNKMRFDGTVKPAEFSEENKISKYAFLIPSKQFSKPESGSVVTVLGGNTRLLLLGKEIRPGKLPAAKIKLPSGENNIQYDKGLDNQGIKVIDIPLNFWGTYDPKLSDATCLNEMKSLTINKPKIGGILYDNGVEVKLENSNLPPQRTIFTIDEGESRPLFLVGLLCFKYSKHKIDEEPGDGTEYKNGLLIAALRDSDPQKLISQYKPVSIYREIIHAAGNLEPNQIISLKSRFMAPNGGLQVFNKTLEEAKSGTVIIPIKDDWKNGKETLFYPSQFEDINDKLILPTFSGPYDKISYPENKEKNYLVEGAAIFGNEAWKNILASDFNVSGETENKANITTTNNRYTKDANGSVKLSVGMHLPDGFFGEKNTSKATMIFKYQIDNTDPKGAKITICEQTIEYEVPKPEIIEVNNNYNSLTETLTITLKTQGLPLWAEFCPEITWKDDNGKTWNNIFPSKQLKSDGTTMEIIVLKNFFASGKISSVSLKNISIKDASFPKKISFDTDIQIEGINYLIDDGALGRTVDYDTTYIRNEPIYTGETKSNKQILIKQGQKIRFLLDDNGKRQRHASPSDFYKIEAVVDDKTYQGWVFTSYLKNIPELKT